MINYSSAITILLFYLLLLHSGAYCEDSIYGPVEIVFTKVETCRGPKSRDCVSKQATLLPGGKIIAIFLNVTENTKPDTGKVMMSSVNQQKQTPLFRMKMDKPCENVFLQSHFSQFLNITKSCVVKKVYDLKVDVARVAGEYFGGKFLIGNFSFKSMFGNRQCNFFCGRFDFSTIPKL